MTDRDDLIAGTDSQRVQRQVQRGGATRDGAGAARADVAGELLLEGRYFRALCDPAGEDCLSCSLGLFLTEDGLGDRDAHALKPH